MQVRKNVFLCNVKYSNSKLNHKKPHKNIRVFHGCLDVDALVFIYTLLELK